MAEATGLRNTALPYPVYGVPFGITFPLLDADGDPISPSSPDSEVSKNGDTFADCTNEATEIATSSGICYLLLTATEMTADVVTVRIQSTGAKTTVMTLYPRKLPTLNSGTVGANAGDGTTLQLAAGAVAIDDFYNGCLLVGTIDTVVEARVISDYVGSTLVCTVSPAFNTAPDNNDTYVVYQPDGRQVGQATVVGWVATALPSPDTAGYPKVTIKDGTGTGEIDTTSGGVLVAAIANNAITAASIATGAIDADAIADNAIDAGAIAADAITAAKIANGAIDAATFAADVDAEILSYLVDDATRIDASALNTAAVTTVPAINTKLGTPADLNGGGATLAGNATDGYNRADAAATAANGASGKLNAITDSFGVAIGGTGNDSTHLHLATLTFGNDEINSRLLVIYDDSEAEYHSRWIEDWVLATNLATVATLPFTPEAGVDLYWLTTIRADVTGGSGLDAAGVRAAIGLASANLDTQLATIDTNVDDIETAVITNAAGVDIAADIIAMKADTAAILADTGTDGVVLANDAITAAKIAANAIGSSEIADGAITSAKFAAGAITATVIATDAIDDDAIATGAIASTAFASGAITAAAIAADAIGASELAADAVTEIAAAISIPSAATIADAVWDEDATAHQTTGTFGQAIGDPGASTETLFKAIVTDPAGTNIAADVIAIKAETAAILDDTDDIGVAGAGLTALATQASVNTIDDFLDTEIAALTTAVDALPTNAELATALGTADDAVLAAIAALNNLSSSAAATAVLTTAMTESYNTDGAAPTLAQAIYLIMQRLTEFAISSTTVTIKKLDGSTTAATLTLDSATDPTSSTRAS